MEYRQLPIVSDRDAPQVMYDAAVECRKETGFYPITFTMMEGLSQREKEKDFANLIPGDHSTYIFGGDKEAYYDDYRKSLFGYTWRKGGWDCNRHTEIFSCGCVPYMHDIRECPKNTMVFYPKETMARVLDMKGIRKPIMEEVYGAVRWRIIEEAKIDHTIFDMKEYNEIREQLIRHTQLYLTPLMRLRYIAKCGGRDELPNNILCYSAYQMQGYLADSIIKSVRELGIGIDYPKKEILYSSNKTTHYEGSMEDFDEELRDNIELKIENHLFDMVFFLDSWRGHTKEFEEFESLCLRHYRKEDLIYICENDYQNIPWNFSPDKLYFKSALPDRY